MDFVDSIVVLFFFFVHSDILCLYVDRLFIYFTLYLFIDFYFIFYRPGSY